MMQSWRWQLLVIGLLAGIALFAGRLFWLMVVEGKQARASADENRMQLRKIAAPRGVIKDRQGEVMARNKPVTEENDKGETVQGVGREYVFGEAGAHIIGYVAEAGEEDISEEKRIVAGDRVGKMGVEKWLDERLRGQDGAEIVEQRADGSLIRKLGRREPVSGEEVSLTIDLGLQKKALEVLGGKRGAVIVSVPETGEILALASSPSFDPAAVVLFLNREDKPMFNRATDGIYPPGSIFKLVTAVAGLETGKIDEQTQIEDIGEIKIGEFRYGNWYFDQYGRKEGVLSIVRALGRSNDIFFYRVGEKVGAEGLAVWAKNMGLGKLMNLDWAAESAGLVPDPDWKERIRGERWFLGNTYHMAIGQGDVAVTPLQVNMLTAMLGNGGSLCKPRIILQPETDRPLADNSEEGCRDVGISQKNLQLVREGMVVACSSGGTAFPFFNFQPQVACKTGTAQHGGEGSLPHAWFTALAPAEKPEVAITVLLEAAGEGSYEAAPVARKILEYWFKDRQGIGN